VIAMGAELKWVAMSGCGGELIGWIFCLWKLSKDHGITQLISYKSNTPVIAYLGCSGLLLLCNPETITLRLLLLALLLVIFVVGMLMYFPSLRSLLHRDSLRSFTSRPFRNAGSGPVKTGE
jgi:hypothetical protein